MLEKKVNRVCSGLRIGKWIVSACGGDLPVNV